MTKKEQILKRLQEQKTIVEAGKTRTKQPVVSKLLEATRETPKRTVKREVAYKPNRGPATITEYVQNKTKGMDKEQRHIYSVLSENIVKAAKTIAEATQAGAGVFGVNQAGAGVGLVKTYFDIFYGYFPSLITPHLASTQPIKTEKAMVFYYETIAGSAKGGVAKGTKLITPFAVNTNVNYTSNTIDYPVIDPADADSGTKIITYSQALPQWGPVVAKSVKIEGVDLTWSSDTAFSGLAEGNDVAGTITADGTNVTVALTVAAGDTLSKKLKVSYAYDNKYAPTQVPELDANIDSREITAYPRTVKTNYSFQAGFGFEAQFGAKLEDKLADSAMYELKRETDLDFVFEIMNSAPTVVQWNKAAGVANGLYEFHKLSFRDAVVAASNHIYKLSKRARGNILLVGVNAQTIVETLPEFKGEESGSQLGGAAKIGTLKNIDVFAIPELDDNDWAVIYKDKKDNLDAGIIFAPYIPVVATNPVTLDDLVIRRAYTCSYGKLVVNPNYFVRGTIVNDPLAMPVFVVGKTGSTYGVLDTDAFLAE